MPACRVFSALSLAVVIAGCASHVVTPTSSPGTENAVPPRVVQQQGRWETFPLGAGHVIDNNQSIATGFDGNMWACDNGAIDRIDTTGHVTSFSVPACSSPTRNPNQHVYFIEGPSNTQIGSIDASGNISALQLDNQALVGVTASDPHKDLFIGSNDGTSQMENINPTTGHVLLHQLIFPGGVGVQFTGLAYGSDGQIWFSCVTDEDHQTPCLGEVSLDLSTYNMSLLPEASNPIAASDGGIWFSEGSAIARVDTSTKTITTYPTNQPVHAVWGTQGTSSHLYFVTAGRKLVSFNIRTHKADLRSTLPDVIDSTESFVIVGPDKN